MNELSCRRVSDLVSADGDRGPIVAPTAPSPASWRNLRRDVASMLLLPVSPDTRNPASAKLYGDRLRAASLSARRARGRPSPATMSPCGKAPGDPLRSRRQPCRLIVETLSCGDRDDQLQPRLRIARQLPLRRAKARRITRVRGVAGCVGRNPRWAL